ncbi:hypothetical protein [Rubrobacter aplysinae]|uniref:hypothetical protein n=1 Tax=Rubrobacter aplysinae TaxID=909625 RepID=UPI00064C1C4E|nr:hypothetical protein [Rubrobacter aplysinae]
MDSKNRFPYLRLVLGVACIAAGIVAGQLVDQRLMLIAMFPAVALLSGVIVSLTAPRAPKTPETPGTGQPPSFSSAERELMAAVWNAGGLRPAEAAEKTSLSEEEASELLAGMAEKGYLRVRSGENGPVYERAAG